MTDVDENMDSALFSTLRADYAANRGDLKALLVLTTFRLSHFLRASKAVPRPVAYAMTIVHRFCAEVIVGIEIRPKTRIGPGLTIFHGFGTVIHDASIIGSNVVLRHNVTIGQAVPGGPCPVVEDGVVFGVGATVLGGVRIGAGAMIGAHALVTSDVPPAGVARAPRAQISPNRKSADEGPSLEKN